MKRLDEQAAVVTGSARGIGRGIAEVLAAEGAAVAIADINASAARATARDLEAAGQRAISIEVDVTDPASIEAMASAAVDAFGRIDILAANAGIYPTARIAEVDEAEWDRVLDLNAKGSFF